MAETEKRDSAEYGGQAMNRRQQPIGVFDSGMGGISVLRELAAIMPGEDYLYFGDSLHAPYGTKSTEEIRALTVRHVEGLLARGAKGIVVACNTATGAAVAGLRRSHPQLPLVGIEPAIKPAAMQMPGARIVVMATPMTLRQEKFQRLMARYENDIRIVPLPCPGLMEFVERGELSGDSLRRYLTELLWSVSGEPIDGIVLGCTHYPFVREMIQEVAGKEVAIYDGGAGTAREMKRRLEAQGLLNPRTSGGQVEFLNSRDTPQEQALCRRLYRCGKTAAPEVP